MTKPTPAELHRIAQQERGRRKAAWQAAGQGLSDRAQFDDALWSNIEQMAGCAANDPICLQRSPVWWSRPQRIIMARNAWATAVKAEKGLDASVEANCAKIAGLWHLYNWLRPVGWSPYFSEEAA